MISLVAGAIPLITKGVQQFFKGREEKRNQEFELKKIEVEFKARAEMAGKVANAEAIKAEMEAKKLEWEYEKERVKSIAEMQKRKTGIKWIDSLLDLNRGFLCFTSVIVVAMSAYNLYKTGSIILTQDQLAEIVFMIISYILGERSAKKVWKK